MQENLLVRLPRASWSLDLTVAAAGTPRSRPTPLECAIITLDVAARSSAPRRHKADAIVPVLCARDRSDIMPFQKPGRIQRTGKRELVQKGNGMGRGSGRKRASHTPSRTRGPRSVWRATFFFLRSWKAPSQGTEGRLLTPEHTSGAPRAARVVISCAIDRKA